MLQSILLQLQTAEVSAPAAATTTEQAQDFSLLSILMMGGPIMIPILLLSIAALAIFIERFLYIKNASKTDDRMLESIKDKIKEGKLDEAKNICARSTGVTARVFEKALNRLGSPVRDIESIMESVSNIEVNRMEKNLPLLSAIAAIAPMFGFLGTVAGMIKSFYNISIASNISIGIIAGGIYEKMITSASGLVVGVLAYMMYTYLNHRIDSVIATLEDNSVDFLDTLYKPANS
ncbi:MAG TPA: MotA/TolQ/ExbB proton channel family protein [Cytophaga sp.]|jgi:biopolymer transport protein ExbB|nr:MotA/TolQ/ExbB proton channel family protein [Cytophaga sp.]